MPPPLTPRLRFTRWRAGDWRTFKPIATDPEVVRHISTGQPWPDERIRGFVERQRQALRTHGFCLWKMIHRRRRRMIGICGLQPLADGGIEIGWWLAKDQWGQGLATEAAAAMLGHALGTLHLARVVCLIQPANAASLRIAEKIGLVHESDLVYRDIPVRCYASARGRG